MRVRWTVPAAEDRADIKNYLQQLYPHFAEPTVRTNLPTHPFPENLTEPTLPWGGRVSSIRVKKRGMKYRYARTSTDDKTAALLLAAFKRARCSNIYGGEGSSGATCQAPRSLIRWHAERLDRPRRSLRDLMTILDDLRTHGRKCRSLNEAVHATTPTRRNEGQLPGYESRAQGELTVRQIG